MASDLDDLLKSIRDEAKKESALVPVKDEGNREENLVDEEIDETILRLLGLEDVFDIDYATYKTLLRERMAAGRMADSAMPTEEVEILTDEFKRVKRNTGRFKVKKKKIKVEDIQKTSPLGKIKGVTESPQKLLPAAKEEPEKSPIDDIIKSLDNIIEILKNQNSLIKETAEEDRKRKEKERRAKLEAGLEKGFKKAVDGAMKIVAPVKSLLQKIIDFFMGILLGRFLIKFIDWFADKENQGKINAIGQFLKDHWPKLAALFLMFGTGLGKFVRGLTSLLIKGTARLIAAAAGMLAKTGIAGAGKFGKVASFLGGKKGKFLTAALSTAATVGTTMAVSGAIDKNFNQPSGEKAEPAQKFSGGGEVLKLPGFFGGGLNFGDMFKGMGTGAMFGPLGMLLGAGLGGFGNKIGGAAKSGLGSLGGFVSGEKGVDKVPAMLSDGEFVMSRGAVEKYGVANLERMNAAGGGNNRPQIVQNVIKAAGGGLIGKPRKLKGDSEPPPPEKEGGPPKASTSVNMNMNMSGGSSGGSNTTNLKIGGGSLKRNYVSTNPTFSPKMNFGGNKSTFASFGGNKSTFASFGGNKSTFASFGGNSLNIFSPTINSAMFGGFGGGNMIMGVNNVLPMMMMVATNMQRNSVGAGTQGTMKAVPQLRPNKAKVNIPGTPVAPKVIIQPPVTTTSTYGGGGSSSPVDPIPTFSASFVSKDKSRTSKILGIF